MAFILFLKKFFAAVCVFLRNLTITRFEKYSVWVGDALLIFGRFLTFEVNKTCVSPNVWLVGEIEISACLSGELTTIVFLSVAVAPSLSVTVRATIYSPSEINVIVFSKVSKISISKPAVANGLLLTDQS